MGRAMRMSGRKLRGGRRYFRKLRDWPTRLKLDLENGTWYDLWHEHPDFHGWSTIGAKARGAHVDVLLRGLASVLERAGSSREPFQVFVTVNSRDSPGDALYFHTPNPNSTNFPHRFEGYRWGASPPAWLARYVDVERFEVGETVFEGERRFVVVPRGRGGRLTNA
jgi:hypothetical protein